MCANITITINPAANNVVGIGPTFIPIEESSKKRINPAPPIGIGALPALLFLRLDCLRPADMIVDMFFNNMQIILYKDVQ